MTEREFDRSKMVLQCWSMARHELAEEVIAKMRQDLGTRQATGSQLA